jgi:hypothetical protein
MSRSRDSLNRTKRVSNKAVDLYGGPAASLSPVTDAGHLIDNRRDKKGLHQGRGQRQIAVDSRR